MPVTLGIPPSWASHNQFLVAPVARLGGSAAVALAAMAVPLSGWLANTPTPWPVTRTRTTAYSSVPPVSTQASLAVPSAMRASKIERTALPGERLYFDVQPGAVTLD